MKTDTNRPSSIISTNFDTMVFCLLLFIIIGSSILRLPVYHQITIIETKEVKTMSDSLISLPPSLSGFNSTSNSSRAQKKYINALKQWIRNYYPEITRVKVLYNLTYNHRDRIETKSQVIGVYE